VRCDELDARSPPPGTDSAVCCSGGEKQEATKRSTLLETVTAPEGAEVARRSQGALSHVVLDEARADLIVPASAYGGFWDC
jgi:hypothetical protein